MSGPWCVEAILKGRCEASSGKKTACMSPKRCVRQPMAVSVLGFWRSMQPLKEDCSANPNLNSRHRIRDISVIAALYRSEALGCPPTGFCEPDWFLHRVVKSAFVLRA